MRWYETNSEELDAIDQVVTQYHAHLKEMVELCRKAGSPRAYDIERAKLEAAGRALNLLGDIRRRET